LTMCTDVDRNDKSRVCEAGSVRVIGRRQIEMYSRLIHTVDHVEGVLREGYDAVDAFLTHMWVVTVTGAPKLWAMRFIEENEKSPRRWYAGAVGWFGFNGNVNTGLVLRTVRLKEGLAEIRVGATLLYDSIPEEEEKETHLKASAFLDLIRGEGSDGFKEYTPVRSHTGIKVLLVDHQDSFVHTLANYLRQTGAEVSTVRSHSLLTHIATYDYDLAVLSPGPGKPEDFNLHATINALLNKKMAIFGVCLGLQGVVEYFGGKLKVLPYPMHGKSSRVTLDILHPLFKRLEETLTLGRYHSLHADASTLPKELKIIARSDDDIIMAVAHHALPVYAVQFHPETILSMNNQSGLRMIENVMDLIDEKRQ
jgi:anthranilate synthase